MHIFTSYIWYSNGEFVNSGQLLDWITGLDYWTGLMDSPLTSIVVYCQAIYRMLHVWQEHRCQY